MWRLFLAQRSTEPFSILKLPAKRSEQHLHPPNLLKEGRAPKISWGGEEREKNKRKKLAGKSKEVAGKEKRRQKSRNEKGRFSA